MTPTTRGYKASDRGKVDNYTSHPSQGKEEEDERESKENETWEENGKDHMKLEQ